jgi:cytochrome c2
MRRLSRPPSLTVWVLWHAAAVVVMTLVPSQLRLGTLVSLPPWAATFLVELAATYVASIVILTFWTRGGRTVSLPELVWIVSAVFGSYCLFLLLTESPYSRSILAAAAVLTPFFIGLSFILGTSLQKLFVVLLTSAAVLMQLAGPKPNELLTRALHLGPVPKMIKTVIDTQLYFVESLSFVHYFDVCPTAGGPCRTPGNGGGIARFAGGYLLSTGEGALYLVERDKRSEALKVRSLADRVPINEKEYVAELGEDALHTFRVTGILVQDRGSAFTLLAAHHYWKVDQKCGVLRVSKLEGEYAVFLAGKEGAKWQTVYETGPCLEARNGSITAGSESGGRMTFVGDGNLLLTVGDHGWDGLAQRPAMAQEPNAAYGKTVLIDLRTGTSAIYSLGHRNPQGLYVDPRKVIWETEHGPQGGDELNIIERGANYGWPLDTYGVQYGTHSWPLNPNQEEHEKLRRPVFSWVPSIAISNLVGVENGLFALWHADLLVGTFKKKALERVRVRDGRVVTVESIPIPGRIRDLLEDQDGTIVLYLDGGELWFLRPLTERSAGVSEEVRGRLLFGSCSGCHSRVDGTSHGIGPDLANVVGRRIGGAPGYRYSSALVKHSGTWSADKLDEFLKDPQDFAPGTKMSSAGISDAADRAALIRFLGGPNTR